MIVAMLATKTMPSAKAAIESARNQSLDAAMASASHHAGSAITRMIVVTIQMK